MAIDNKPTDKPEWIPSNNPSYILDPGAKATNGWIGEAVASKVLNWFWNRTSQWIDYLDSLNHFVADYTVSLTAASTAAIDAAQTEIDSLPDNLNDFTLTIDFTVAGNYTPTNRFSFSNFKNGTVELVNTSGGTVTISKGYETLLVEDCDSFKATGFTIAGGGNYSATELSRVNSVYFSNCILKNINGISDTEAACIEVSKARDCVLSSCTFQLIYNGGYDAISNYTNMTLLSPTVTSNYGVFAGRYGGVVVHSDLVTADIGAGETGGGFRGLYKYLNIVALVTDGTSTEDLTGLKTGQTLYIWSIGGSDIATIKVIKVEGTKLYYYKVSGAAPSGSWNLIATDVVASGDDIASITAAAADSDYTTIYQSI